MKKPAFPAALMLVSFVGLALPGCPIYDDSDGCFDTSDCAYGYVCDEYSGDCVAERDLSCRRPSDCGVNETCDRFGTCSSGDCSFASVGCVAGYECSNEQGIWECVREGQSSGGQGSGGSDGSVGGEANAAGAASSSGGAPGSSGGAGAGGEAEAVAGAGGANAGAGGA
jgi:hypothetical protein